MKKKKASEVMNGREAREAMRKVRCQVNDYYWDNSECCVKWKENDEIINNNSCNDALFGTVADIK